MYRGSIGGPYGVHIQLQRERERERDREKMKPLTVDEQRCGCGGGVRYVELLKYLLKVTQGSKYAT